MAHFAQLDNDLNVIQIIVINNNVLLDESGIEQEILGKQFCTNLLGGNWIQTSYNGNIRKNFAGIGYSYDLVRDAFIPIKPYASWILDENTCRWEPPVPLPNDDKNYIWDEDSQNWIEEV